MKTTLSPRQKQIVELIVAGRANKEIAAALCISVRTVETHILVIRGRLGASNRAQAACIFQKGMRKAQNHEKVNAAVVPSGSNRVHHKQAARPVATRAN